MGLGVGLTFVVMRTREKRRHRAETVARAPPKPAAIIEMKAKKAAANGAKLDARRGDLASEML